MTVAGIDTFNRSRMDGARQQFEEGFQGHLANTETALVFHEARSDERDFISAPNETSVTDHAKDMKETFAGVAKLQSIHKEGEVLAIVSQLDKTLHAYNDKFANVVALQREIGLTQDKGLMGALRASVHQIESRLDGVGDEHLSAQMLMLRRHEKDFLARGDKSYADKLEATFVEFTKGIDAARSLTPKDKAEIRALAAAYVGDFRKVVATTTTINAVITELNALSAATTPSLDAIRADGLEDLNEGQETVAKIEAQTQVVMNTTMAAVGILVVLLVWFIARGISRPVVAMTAAMTDLAQGRKDTVIPGTEYRNEVGAMAAAVQVFKDNMIKAEALAAEQVAEQKAKEARAEKVATRTLSFDGIIKSALSTVTSAGQQLEGSAQAMQATAEETNVQSSAVAAASEQASANVQTVAAATEELSSSIQEIGRQVTQSSQTTAKAVTEANRAKDMVLT